MITLQALQPDGKWLVRNRFDKGLSDEEAERQARDKMMRWQQSVENCPPLRVHNDKKRSIKR